MMFLIRPKPDNSFISFRPSPPKGFPSDRVSQVTKPVPWLRSPPSKLLVPSLPYSNRPQALPQGRFLSQRSLTPHPQGHPQRCSTPYTNSPPPCQVLFPYFYRYRDNYCIPPPPSPSRPYHSPYPYRTAPSTCLARFLLRYPDTPPLTRNPPKLPHPPLQRRGELYPIPSLPVKRLDQL